MQLGRVEAFARHEALAQHLRLAHAVEPEERGWSRSTSQVCTYQCGSRRSIEYGSTVRVNTSCSSGFRYSSSTSFCVVDRPRERVDEPFLLADVRRRRLGQIERTERLLELRPNAVEWGVGARGDHRPDELEGKPDRAGLERSQPRWATEGVAEELLVDVHLVALELGVDGVAAATEVDEVEEREVLLQLVGRDREAIDQLLRGDHSLALSPQAVSR